MAQAEVAAKITKASGPISVERNGKTFELNEGDTVYATDVIYTKTSAIELLFTDETVVNLSPNSTLKVQEFSYDIGEDPAFVLSLARGAMRTLSGKLVELNPDAFKVLTPKATAGIRGTEFVTIVRLDSGEQHTLLDIDPGHNFVVTSHNGTQISLSISGGNIVIAAGSDTTMSEGAITQEEVLEIIRDILGALTDDASVVLTNPFTQLQLDAKAQAALQEVLQNALDSLTAGDVNILGSDDGSDGNDDPLDGVAPPPVIVAVVDPSSGDDQEIKYPVTTSGEVNFYADDDVAAVNGVIEALSHIVTITGTNETSERIQISGDVNMIEGGVTVEGGNDEIIGGRMQNTEITGDAVEGLGNLEGGDDFIHVSSLSNSHIAGDMLRVESGAVVCGSDTIVVTGDMDANSAIFGDVNGPLDTGGNDSITVGGTMSGGLIEGKGGNDTISVVSVDSSVSNTNIYGGAGNDTIVIGSLFLDSSYSGVSGGDGSDRIEITTLHYGGVSGDAGNDTIEVGDFKGGGIVGGDGADSITARITGSNVEIYASDGSGTDGSKDVVRLTHDGSGSVTLYDMVNGEDELYVSGSLVTIESSGTITKDGLTIVFST